MKKYLCLGCGFTYDEALGLPEHGIAPGLRDAQIGLRHGRDPVLRRSEGGVSVRFILRAGKRGYSFLPSLGPNASYVAGHPDGAITRHSASTSTNTGRASQASGS